MANLCASGMLERFPGLRFATIEAGIGWLPWVLDAMDEAYRKHHFWVRPKLRHLPREYFRMHGFASFQEDAVGLALERTMGGLRDDARAKVLGLNAARFFKFDVPERYRRPAA